MLLKSAQKRWPVSGNISLDYQGKRFLLQAKCDDGLTNRLFYEGTWAEDQQVKLFMTLSREARVIYDVGAFVGLYSILCRLENTKSDIYAFEPNPYNFNRLNRNLELNNINSVRTLELALGNESNQVDLWVPEEALTSDVSSTIGQHTTSFYDFKYKQVQVAQNSIDNLVGDKIIAPPSLMKIDAEFQELKILQGAQQTLQDYAPLLFIEIFDLEVKRIQNPKLSEVLDEDWTLQVEQLLKSLGYYFYAFTPWGLSKIESLLEACDNRNFVLSKHQITKRFCSYDDFAYHATKWLKRG